MKTHFKLQHIGGIIPSYLCRKWEDATKRYKKKKKKKDAWEEDLKKHI